jgi:hypothetical protein
VRLQTAGGPVEVAIHDRVYVDEGDSVDSRELTGVVRYVHPTMLIVWAPEQRRVEVFEPRRVVHLDVQGHEPRGGGRAH